MPVKRDEEPEVALTRLFGELRSLLHDGDPSATRREDVWSVMSAASEVDHARCLEVFVPYLKGSAYLFEGQTWRVGGPLADVKRELRRRSELMPFARFRVHLEADEAGDALTDALAAALWMDDVEQLSLAESGLSARDIEALDTSLCLLTVSTLILDGNAIGDRGAVALASATSLEGLRELHLVGCEVDWRGAIAFAGSGRLGRLERLNLQGNVLPAGAFATFMDSPCLRALRRLDLSANHLYDGASLTRPRCPPALESLVMSNNDLDDMFVEILAGSAGLAGLKELDLSCNAFGDSGALALAGSPHLTNLEALHLDGNRITSRGWLALSGSPHLDDALRATYLEMSR